MHHLSQPIKSIISSSVDICLTTFDWLSQFLVPVVTIVNNGCIVIVNNGYNDNTVGIQYYTHA